MKRKLGSGTSGLVTALIPGEVPAASESARIRQLERAIPNPNAREVWLVSAVYGRTLPSSGEVERLVRIGSHAGMAGVIAEIAAHRNAASRFARPVEVVADAILLDINDTASTGIGTGVQRVSREVGKRWHHYEDVMLVGWSSNRGQLHEIDGGAFHSGRRRGILSANPIVPWNSRYVLAEAVNETERSTRIQALAQYSGNTTTAIGYDAIPLTTAETTGTGMAGAFAKYLSAISQFDEVATISGASAVEYRGWRDMLGSAGITGPNIVTVPLAVEVGVGDLASEERARKELQTGALPMVLCVGSHEPRKNHAVILHASEILWREGHKFSLVFVGGNAWGSEAFAGAVESLTARSRPVRVFDALPDDILWWAYRFARFTVFPSLNEGFGLPIAESLAAGTPVVTSGFGSMAEIAAGGGCHLVDPRDDCSVTEGMRTLLVDDRKLESLSKEAEARTPRSWERYTSELWNAIVK